MMRRPPLARVARNGVDLRSRRRRPVRVPRENGYRYRSAVQPRFWSALPIRKTEDSNMKVKRHTIYDTRPGLYVTSGARTIVTASATCIWYDRPFID
jgi:hypothetical protein